MNLDALIKAERNAPPEATREQSREVWSSIERSVVGAPLLAPLAAGKVSTLTKFGAALSTTAGKVVLATAIVAGGTAGALSIPPPSTEAPQTAKEKPAPKPAPKAKRAPKSASLAATPAPTPAPEEGETEAVPIQRPKSAEPQRPKAVAPAAAPEAPNEPEEPEEAAKLEHGLLLIKRAEKALKKGKYDVALAFLRRHRTLYPESPLIEHREALFVQALCSGDRSLAAKARWDFNRKWPESRYRDHLREICLEPQSH